MTEIRVVLADDQESVRSAYRFFLDRQPGITVVGEARDGAEAVRTVRHLRPDVAILDVRMPVLDGLAATAQLADAGDLETTKVVIATTFDLDEYVDAALSHGASGFILKDTGPALLAEAVRAAAVGDSLISPSVTVRLLRHLAERRTPAVSADRAPGPVRLSDREEQVVALVAVGRTNQEIADALHLSVSTVKTHLASVQTRLSVRNRVEIAAWAWRTGRGDGGAHVG